MGGEDVRRCDGSAEDAREEMEGKEGVSLGFQ